MIVKDAKNRKGFGASEEETLVGLLLGKAKRGLDRETGWRPITM